MGYFRALALAGIIITPYTTVAQSIVYATGTGKTVVMSAQVNSNLSTFTNIYVVFPPAVGANNHANFASSVMTADAIDGVTLTVPWSQVEKPAAPPTTTPCSTGTDVCQQDPTNASYYHTYDWSTIDGTGCADMNVFSSSPWFCLFGTNYKTVNFILAGIGDPPSNPFTPAYITSQSWVMAVGGTYQHQDAVNSINASGCNLVYSGSITGIPGGVSFTGNGVHTVNVTGWTTPPVTDGDMIWVSGLPAAIGVTGQYGATVSTSGCGGGASFCYTVTGTATGGPSPATGLVKAVDSWPVPFEAPYAAGWLAFLKAAVYHFNTLNISAHQNLGQIRYIRPGVAKGGEAQPICTTFLPMTNTTPTYNQSQWVSWYTQVAQTVQSANPLMQVMLSINNGSTTLSAIPIAEFANAEAGVAVTTPNSTGLYDGFGSQGLKHADSGFTPSSCPETGTLSPPDTGNNWGCMFTKYWSGSNITVGSMAPAPTTVPLELQQIDCSNPTGMFNAGDGCFIGSSGGQTGNLADDYTFATANHAAILEIYAQDALLAYDPNFCDTSGGGTSCKNPLGSGLFDWFGTDLSASTQYNFYKNAGQGTSGCSGTNCPYAAAIETAHGRH